MTTAQDQQSRAEFEAHALSEGWAHRDPQYGFVFYDQSPKVIAWKSWQAARTLPAGVKPAFTRRHEDICGDEVGPPEFGYSAAQVLAMGRVPPGWQAVPVEPTQEMVRAGYYQELKAAQRREMYRAMLAAAPRPPAAQEGA